MIVAAHPPCFLPWLGYLDRMQRADLFIVLDHAHFDRRKYQNRARILLDGEQHWLTVPVLQRSQQERIVDKQIDNPLDGERKWWGSKMYQTMAHAYRAAPYFNLYGPLLQEILEIRLEHLVDLDQLMLELLRNVLEIDTPLVNSSELSVSSARSDLILDLCQSVGADTYLAGMGSSRQYLDQAAFAAAGIEIAWQEFVPPVYTQCGVDAFVPGLSAIDLLFNHGPDSVDILHGMASQPASMAADADKASYTPLLETL